ncbi:hypothetical protein WJX72_004585 [[Myrmecia] bisecta]|uniref:EamA domain-containing protein n=1 Tax=[Myrmecia] bisecta TaxID=41462 RepID=A0AAW1R6J6_9CHLO
MGKEEAGAAASGDVREPLLQNGPPTPSSNGTDAVKARPRYYHGEEGQHTVRGLCLYACSSVFLATMLVFAKILGERHMPVFEILLARSTIICAIALVKCAKDRVNPLGNRRGLLMIRGLFGFGAIGCYFWAVTLLPLNDCMVLTFLAPLWVAALGPFLIHEKPSKFVLVAVPCCIAGVICITQPSFLGFGSADRSKIGILLACGQAFCSAFAKMAVRELRSTETPNVSVIYLSGTSTIAAVLGCTLPRLLGWEWHSVFRLPVGPLEWALMIGLGLTGYGTQICMTYALQYAKAAPAIAMSYLSIVWGLLYGFFIFHEVPTVLSLVGAALICSCTFMLGIFEKKKKVTDVAVEDVSTAQQQAQQAEINGAYQSLASNNV